MPIAAAVLAVAAIMPAKGWNNVGHSVIAYIAEQHLTPEAKEKCRGYLHHTLPYYASWMDYWRNCAGFEATSKGMFTPRFSSSSRMAAFTFCAVPTGTVLLVTSRV